MVFAVRVPISSINPIRKKISLCEWMNQLKQPINEKTNSPIY